MRTNRCDDVSQAEEKRDLRCRCCCISTSIFRECVACSGMAHVPDLRSPHDEVGGLVYFGRMLDKIRLEAAGKLPEDYTQQLGPAKGSFDWRCLNFLHVDYEAVKAQTLTGASDAEMLQWCFEHGRKPSDEEIEIWNAFMTKRGWRDAGRERLIFRLDEAGIPASAGVETMFEFIDIDEGRPLKSHA